MPPTISNGMKSIIALNAVVALTATIPQSQAATVFALNNFESSLGIWTAGGTSSGRYVATSTLQPTDDTTTNFATGTSGTNFTSGGTGAASVGKSGGTLTSTVADLSGGGASETLTINFDFVLHNGSSTRRSYVEYSNDGGTNWFTLAMMQVGAASVANKISYSGSVTITEGSSTVTRSGSIASPNLYTGAVSYNGSAFTNNSKIRIINQSSAGADARLFIDNLEVLSSAAIPEPSSALLGVMGIMAILRRRR